MKDMIPAHPVLTEEQRKRMDTLSSETSGNLATLFFMLEQYSEIIDKIERLAMRLTVDEIKQFRRLVMQDYGTLRFVQSVHPMFHKILPVEQWNLPYEEDDASQGSIEVQPTRAHVTVFGENDEISFVDNHEIATVDSGHCVEINGHDYDLPPYFTTEDVAQLEGITPQRVRQYCKEGRLQAWRTSGQRGEWRIVVDQFLNHPRLEDLLKSKEKEVVTRMQAFEALDDGE